MWCVNGLDVPGFEALTVYIRRHAVLPKEGPESIGSAVDEMLTLCAAAEGSGLAEEAASLAELASRTAPALVAALSSWHVWAGAGGAGGGKGGKGSSMQIVAGKALRSAAAVPRVLVAAARAGAATAALRVIERFPLPPPPPSLSSLPSSSDGRLQSSSSPLPPVEILEHARSSVLTLWELISDEQPSSSGGGVETYGEDSKARVRSVMEETFYDVTALCPSLTGSAVVSLISLLDYFAASVVGKPGDGGGGATAALVAATGGKQTTTATEKEMITTTMTQPEDVRVASAALGLVRFWSADDFNRHTLALAGAGTAAIRLLAHPDGAVRRSAARAVASLVAFPAAEGLVRRLALTVGPLATCAARLESPAGKGAGVSCFTQVTRVFAPIHACFRLRREALNGVRRVF